MQLIKTIKYITSHPLTRNNKWSAMMRFFNWQIKKSFDKKGVTYPFVEESKLLVKKGMAGATGNIYVGLHEFEDMGFLLHFLEEQDLFVDIGANIGAYTVLASKVKKARTISIEPVPETHGHLVSNVKLNEIEERVSTHNIGIGSESRILSFTADLDTVNHVILNKSVANFETVDVKVKPLDDLLEGHSPCLLKIDVEGFEQEVLDGATKTLSKDSLSAIIIELNGSGGRYGYSDSTIHKKLIGFGFAPYNYDPFNRQLLKLTSFNTTCNTIYIRNEIKVNQKLKVSKRIKILNQYL